MNQLNSRGEIGLDTRILSDFVIQLNISRRHFVAYPKNHPLVARSAARALKQLRALLEPGGELALGVAREALLVGDSSLDKDNPVYRDLARALFDRGIAMVVFRQGVSEEEFLLFNDFLCRPSEAPAAPGKIGQEAADAGLRNIEVRGIDYHNFHVTEEDRIERPNRREMDEGPGLLWEDFVQGLMKGVLDPTGEERTLPGSLHPEILSALLNKHVADDGREEDYESVIASFVRKLGSDPPEAGAAPAFIDKLRTLVSGLKPELRRQFLHSTFRTVPLPEETVETFERFSAETLLETLAEINSNEATVPPSVWNLLQRFSGAGSAAGLSRRVSGEKVVPAEDEIDRWKTLLGTSQSGDFVPEGYQKALSAMVSQDLLPTVQDPEIEELKRSLTDHAMEQQFCRIILQVMQSLPAGGEEETGAASARNLCDLCGYFLEIGDFSFLTAIHGRMQEMDALPAAREVLAVFETADFMQAVLNAPALWGKGKHPEIRRLIRAVGLPFVEPLLDRLAEEPTRSVRRFLIESLIEQGKAVRGPAIARLTDERWYLVRNLVLILRILDDPGVLRPFHRLLAHPHPRVRQELLKTFLHFGAPEADRLLLEELDSKDRDRQLVAVQLAEKSRSATVVEKLLEILRKRGISGFTLELKVAVVRTLGSIGNPDALPEMEKLLWSKNPFFFPKLHEALKTEVARSLSRYPAERTGELLRRLLDCGQPDLARLAGREGSGGAKTA